MPGMDGFQAVQSIKNNPRTSAIPILMYTSQEGDLYLGQARALGAEGVLPKQIKQADVTKMLYPAAPGVGSPRRASKLLSCACRTRRPICCPPTSPPSWSTPAEPAIAVRPAAGGCRRGGSANSRSCCRRCRSRSVPRSTRPLQKEIAALRSFIGSTLDSQSERLQGDLADAAAGDAHARTRLPTVMPERRPWARDLRLVAGAHRDRRRRRSCPGCGGSRAARSPRCAPTSRPPTPKLETLRARPEVVSRAAAGRRAGSARSECGRCPPPMRRTPCRPRPGSCELVPASDASAPAAAPVERLLRRPRAAPRRAAGRGECVAPQTTQAQ